MTLRKIVLYASLTLSLLGVLMVLFSALVGVDREVLVAELWVASLLLAITIVLVRPRRR